MNKYKKWIALGAVTALAVGTLCSCGSSQEQKAAEAVEAAEAVDTIAVTELAAKVYENIQNQTSGGIDYAISIVPEITALGETIPVQLSYNSHTDYQLTDPRGLHTTVNVSADFFDHFGAKMDKNFEFYVQTTEEGRDCFYLNVDNEGWAPPADVTEFVDIVKEVGSVSATVAQNNIFEQIANGNLEATVFTEGADLVDVANFTEEQIQSLDVPYVVQVTLSADYFKSALGEIFDNVSAYDTDIDAYFYINDQFQLTAVVYSTESLTDHTKEAVATLFDNLDLERPEDFKVELSAYTAAVFYSAGNPVVVPEEAIAAGGLETDAVYPVE